MTHQETPIAASRGHKKFWLLLVIGTSLTVASGAVYGHLSQRWGPPADLVAAAKRLQTMPKELGDWQLLDELAMSESAIRMLECAGHVNRRYANRRTGDSVSIAIIVGPPGPTAVHTPEICYSSREYDIHEPRQVVTLGKVGSMDHSFWKLSFRSRNVTAERLRVYYAWNAGGAWTASRRPRFEFASLPMLFKIQLAGLVAPDGLADDDDPCREFLEELLKSDWTISGARP